MNDIWENQNKRDIWLEHIEQNFVSKGEWWKINNFVGEKK